MKVKGKKLRLTAAAGLFAGVYPGREFHEKPHKSRRSLFVLTQTADVHVFEKKRCKNKEKCCLRGTEISGKLRPASDSGGRLNQKLSLTINKRRKMSMLQINMPHSFKSVRLSPGLLLVGVLAFIGLLASGDASAADTLNRGAEFQEVYELVHDWATGFLGKSISLTFLIIGLCLGVARGSILAAATCICAAVALLLAPSIVDTLFAAHT